MRLALLGAASLLALHSFVAGSITRAQFTSAIKDRQPTDSLTSVGADTKEIYFYTDLKGFAGTKITHKWEHDGKVALERTFDVGADRWRAWSNKALGPHAAGEWKVIVLDGSGATLGSYTLKGSK
jgi:hypothetical protein